MLLIEIGDNAFNVSAEQAFNTLFQDAPNSMCIMQGDKIINFNTMFIERCGYTASEELLPELTVTEKKRRSDDQSERSLIIEAYTKGRKHIGGEILLSELVEKDFSFGFIQVMWIEGLEEFEKVVDQMNHLIKNFLNESNGNQ